MPAATPPSAVLKLAPSDPELAPRGEARPSRNQGESEETYRESYDLMFILKAIFCLVYGHLKG